MNAHARKLVSPAVVSAAIGLALLDGPVACGDATEDASGASSGDAVGASSGGQGSSGSSNSSAGGSASGSGGSPFDAASSSGAPDAEAGLPDASAEGDGATSSGSSGDGGGSSGDAGSSSGTSPMLGGCPMLPPDHVFNTPIDALPVDPGSASYMSEIGTANLHLDLGTTVDQASPTYYGIPYNLVHGASIVWSPARFFTTDPYMTWNARGEADCAAGAGHVFTSPCTTASAPSPLFPIPASPLVEGGIDTDPSHPYGDHHILVVDQDTCHLWETYHAYPTPGVTGGWDIYGAARFDLRSNALRPDTWTSADAAGFPILPLLLRAEEAETGTIAHALRFTVPTGKIRIGYTWPARHLTNNGTTSTSLPPMGQLFRLKASFPIPGDFNVQSKAILTAMKTYGMYIADGGSRWYVTGDPSAAWRSSTFSQVQSVSSTWFEAVDLAPVRARSGWSPDSGRAPPP